jgi:chemotaxis methyl-accepting protein methylase
MSSHEQELWRELIWSRSGLFFSEGRLRYMRQRLWERLVPRGYRDYSDYYQFVRFNSQGENEFSELLSRCVLPALADGSRFGADGSNQVEPITMWSAGCSNGQEAYSMAMTFLDSAECKGLKARIFGTDLSITALQVARRGRFRQFELRALPDACRERHMVRVTIAGEHFHQVSRVLREMVRFSHLNLADLASCALSNVDVIFCQNVLIYFKDEDRSRIAAALCERLKPGGFLFLAAAEAVGLSLAGMQPVRIPDAIVYQRCG